MASPNRCMSATGSSAATADDDDDVLCQLAPLALGDWQGRVVELREQVAADERGPLRCLERQRRGDGRAK